MDRWNEVVARIDFAYSSKKDYNTFNRLTGRNVRINTAMSWRILLLTGYWRVSVSQMQI